MAAPGHFGRSRFSQEDQKDRRRELGFALPPAVFGLRWTPNGALGCQSAADSQKRALGGSPEPFGRNLERMRECGNADEAEKLEFSRAAGQQPSTFR